MINVIWLLMMLVAFAVSVVNGNVDQLAVAAFDGATEALELVLALLPILMLWLGVMELMEAAGMLKILAWLFSPILGLLFPRLPKESPAREAITLNFAANFLGLGNAATPFGLRAMGELENLNSTPKVASNEMITLLLLNTSAVSLVPSTIIALRVGAGSENPTAMVFVTVAASIFGLVVGLFCHWLFCKVGER